MAKTNGRSLPTAHVNPPARRPPLRGISRQPMKSSPGILAIADEVGTWCEKANAFGRTVTVKVKFADFHQVTRSRSFPVSIARHDLLRQASVELVRMVLPTMKGVRLLGVSVSNFDRAPTGSAGELPLFDTGEVAPRVDGASIVAPTGAG